VLEHFVAIAIFLLLVSIPAYGLLRLGIYIGAHRAVDNIVFGYMSAGRDHSEMPEEMKALQSAIANRNCWYGLFGVSKSDWYRNKATAEIGNRLEFLTFEAGRGYQEHVEEMASNRGVRR
jgi:hypothetical protein